jgi:hypothetical protein
MTPELLIAEAKRTIKRSKKEIDLGREQAY